MTWTGEKTYPKYDQVYCQDKAVLISLDSYQTFAKYDHDDQTNCQTKEGTRSTAIEDADKPLLDLLAVI